MTNGNDNPIDASEQLIELRARNAALQETIEELASNLEQANVKRYAAEQRLIKTRGSLTYQLGYQLKTGLGSLSGGVRLPWALFNLYRKASKQRKRAEHKSRGGVRSSKPSPFQAPSPEKIFVPPTPRPLKVTDYDSICKRFFKSADQPRTALKVACIMDEFTFTSYRYECNLLQLTPMNWEAELRAFQPELVFVESAWRGKDDLWHSKVGHNAQELKDMLAWCRQQGIATVFWNKEDPVHFDVFIAAAAHFDSVFTVDIDCIQRYKRALGHERVYVLPFACQPALHNPVELYERKDAFCFAGSYYARYPERTRVLDNFFEQLPTFRPMEIFDRNFGKNVASYQFPEQYQPHIVGTLKFNEIDTAYKGYCYAINLNTVKQSQSMCARRVFELIGCNTLTVSNFARSLHLLFGDLVISTDNGKEILRRLDAFTHNEQGAAKLRLAALRKVMLDHTYTQRLGYVMSKVTGSSPLNEMPRICVFAHAATHSELEALIEHFERQRYANMQMHIVIPDQLVGRPVEPDARVHLLTLKETTGLSLHDLIDNATWVAGMVAQDYYGPNYLLDLALATRYSEAQMMGKGAFYENAVSSTQLQNAELVYRPVARLAARSALIHAELLSGHAAGDWIRSLPELEVEHDQALAIDIFNYCRNAGTVHLEHLCALVDDPDLNTGISIEQLQARAEAIPPLKDQHSVPEWSGKTLAELFGPLRGKQLSEQLEANTWHIHSTLADGKHEYFYAMQVLDIAQLSNSELLKLHLEMTPGLGAQLVVLFMDANKQRISHVMQRSNRDLSADIPPEAKFVRLGVRVQSSGSAEIKALLLGHRDVQPSDILSNADHLLVAKHYPAYDDLYRHGFVHARVTAYQKRGLDVDVFRLRKSEIINYHEFENINVLTGSKSTLATMLEKSAYKSILVHFLDENVWEVLSQHSANTQIIVWVHGAEIQPWWRRQFNYSTDEQLQLAKIDSEKRLAFWQKILQPMPINLKLVFVSHYFAEEVMEDLGFRLPEDQYEIIHNPINTTLFSYQEKPLEQRKKILSIRPYASAKYANDLSVKAIELLAQKPYFKELEFRMVGDGVLFEETLAPLRKYPNVKIEKGFLTHAKIATLHKEYGLFLCPTRMDAQGVSRDEAMASGLVPVTNSVTAIPEFVDDQCGILAPGEDAHAMAKGMARIFENPQLFSSLSMAARQRIERQTAVDMIMEQELAVIAGTSIKATPW